jgi:hypothetical protein
MFHDPHGDHLGITTNELICVLMSRLDASRGLFSLLALMVELSEELAIESQDRMAATLHDAADLIQQRPSVRRLFLEGPRS